jgi:hypothetical protein
VTKAYEETWEVAELSAEHARVGIVVTCKDGEKQVGDGVLTFGWGNGPRSGQYERARLCAQAPAMARMLIDIEWGGTVIGCGAEGKDCCPSCGALGPIDDPKESAHYTGYFKGSGAPGEHFADCELAAVLRAAGVLP